MSDHLALALSGIGNMVAAVGFLFLSDGSMWMAALMCLCGALGAASLLRSTH